MNKIFVEVTGERATKIFFYNESQSKVAAIASEINGIPWHNKLWQHLARSHFRWFVCCWEYFFLFGLLLALPCCCQTFSSDSKWAMFLFFFSSSVRVLMSPEKMLPFPNKANDDDKKKSPSIEPLLCVTYETFFSFLFANFKL